MTLQNRDRLYHLSDIQGHIASLNQRPASGPSLSFSTEGGREREREREREIEGDNDKLHFL